MDFIRKVVNYFLAITLVISSFMLFGTKQANAEALTNFEQYVLGTSVSGTITENGNEKQYYRFTLPSSGYIEISGNAYMQWVYMYLYDNNANELWRKNSTWNSTSEVISINDTVYLTAGDYYFGVGRDGSNYGNFNIRIDFHSIDESFTEMNGGNNNTIATASVLQTDGTSYNSQIAQNDDKDFYRFTLPQSGKVSFNATFYKIQWVYWKLYDESGQEILSKNPSWNNITENIVVNEDLYLTSGTYFISVSKDGDNFGKYMFSLPFTSSNEDYAEINGGSNNMITSASPLILENNYKGQIAINDEKDFYEFTLSSSQSVNINVEAGMRWIYLKLYDANGNELWSRNPNWNDVTQKISFSEISTLEQGKYYIALVRDGDSYGDYTLNISGLTQSNCTHDYKSEWHDATYFSQGYRQYTCQLCGDSYKADYVPAKELSQVYLSSYCSVGKGKLKLSWSTVYEASGYQIRYSTSKSFKGKVNTLNIKGQTKYKKTIKGLARNRNYYVQVRAYKTDGAKKVYGQWSVKRCLRTK